VHTPDCFSIMSAAVWATYHQSARSSSVSHWKPNDFINGFQYS